MSKKDKGYIPNVNVYKFVRTDTRFNYRKRLESGRYLLTGSVNIDSVEIHFGVFDTTTKPPKTKLWYMPRRTLHQQLDLPDLDDEKAVDALKKRLNNRIDLVMACDLGCSCVSSQFAGLYDNYDPPEGEAMEVDLDATVDSDEHTHPNSKHGIQMNFRQREVDRPLREYRNWLKGRKEACEVNIRAVESAAGKEYDPMIAAVLVSFYSDPTVKRRKFASDRKRLAIMDRRADLDVDLPAKYFGLLDDKNYQPTIVASLGKADDRGWRQAANAQCKSYSTYAKVRIRPSRNVNRRVRVVQKMPDSKCAFLSIELCNTYVHRQYRKICHIGTKGRVCRAKRRWH